MTVVVESERHLHRPRVYISNPTNIVSLYTLSHLLQCHEDFHIYYEAVGGTAEEEDEELIKKICPRAIKEVGPVAKGMERSIMYLQEGMNEEDLKKPIEGYHRFVLIISQAGLEDSSPLSHLESLAKNSGYESYCILRLAPIYQDLNGVEVGEEIDGEFYGIDAEDAGSAVGHILMDPELHRGEVYTIFSPSSIAISTLKTVHSQLPHPPGPALHSPSTYLQSIKSKYWRSPDRNDFARITGGEEMTSFEEFLRRTHQSLFHQRFIARN